MIEQLLSSLVRTTEVSLTPAHSEGKLRALANAVSQIKIAVYMAAGFKTIMLFGLLLTL